MKFKLTRYDGSEFSDNDYSVLLAIVAPGPAGISQGAGHAVIGFHCWGEDYGYSIVPIREYDHGWDFDKDAVGIVNHHTFVSYLDFSAAKANAWNMANHRWR